MQPTQQQQAVFDAVAGTAAHIDCEAVAGAGKCLGEGTPVLLFNGSIVPVEQVKTGDLLMGPDSQPRRVLNTNVGFGKLFRVVPTKGDPWVCNSEHVLTLRGTNRFQGQILDIPLNYYLCRQADERSFAAQWKLFSVAVDFPAGAIPTVDPYFLGLWFGDGTKAIKAGRGLTLVAVSKPDPEVEETVRETASDWGLSYRTAVGSCPTHVLTRGMRTGKNNPLLDSMRSLVGPDLDVPSHYLTGSRETRGAFLAGWLDSDGHLTNGYYEITQKRRDYADAIAFLARSLGFRVCLAVKTVHAVQYYRLSIIGDGSALPLRLPRKKAQPRKQIKDPLVTGFEVQPLDSGLYYGFTLDGDGRFLLGDFTVTHNTTTLVHAAGHCRGKVGFAAFNSHIADEMKARLGAAAIASTLHSLGYAACRRACPGIELDASKPKRLLRLLRDKWFWQGRNGAWYPNDTAKAVLRLASLCKYTLADETCIDDLDALVDHYDVELTASSDAIYAATAELIEAEAQDVQTLDFDDQIWLPLRKGWAVGGFDVLFVDECQDLSRMQQTLARKAGARLVICGDVAQAIYGFSGSDCDALPRLVAELKADGAGCSDRPLTITWRCPRSHVALARKIVPHIEPAEHAADGYVYQTDPAELHRELQPGDLAICRRNAPLVSTVYRLLTTGVPAVIKGRDVGSNLLDLVKLLKASTPEELGRKLTAYETKERSRLERRNASEDQLQALVDRVTCLDTLASQCESLGELEYLVTTLFSDDAAARAGKVVLSSVHRAKGLEANRVVLLEPARLGTSHKNAQDWERVQNRNLAYIALTRSKSEMVFAGDVPAICNGAGAVVGKRPLF